MEDDFFLLLNEFMVEKNSKRANISLKIPKFLYTSYLGVAEQQLTENDKIKTVKLYYYYLLRTFIQCKKRSPSTSNRQSGAIIEGSLVLL